MARLACPCGAGLALYLRLGLGLGGGLSCGRVRRRVGGLLLGRTGLDLGGRWQSNHDIFSLLGLLGQAGQGQIIVSQGKVLAQVGRQGLKAEAVLGRHSEDGVLADAVLPDSLCLHAELLQDGRGGEKPHILVVAMLEAQHVEDLSLEGLDGLAYLDLNVDDAEGRGEQGPHRHHHVLSDIGVGCEYQDLAALQSHLHYVDYLLALGFAGMLAGLWLRVGYGDCALGAGCWLLGLVFLLDEGGGDLALPPVEGVGLGVEHVGVEVYGLFFLVAGHGILEGERHEGAAVDEGAVTDAGHEDHVVDLQGGGSGHVGFLYF